MATDLDKLIVQLSADIKGYERAMTRASGIMNRQAREIENRARSMNKKLDSIMQRSANSFIAPLAAISTALSVREVTRYADAWTVAQNKINAASEISGMQARSLEDLNKIADETRSGITETVDLYAKLMRSTSGVAKSEMEVAKATEIVNKAFKAGGAAASEQAAGILQLSQGLGSGTLQGDELRSVRENAPILAQAIADYYKVSIAGLKNLGEEGQITSEGVFKAILAATPKIQAAYATTNATIQDGITRVSNAFTQYIGQTDSSLSASQRLVAGLTALADNFDSIADVTVKVAAVIAGALVGRSIAGMIAKLGLATSAIAKFIAAARAATTMTGLTAAIGGLSAAAGPIGALLGVTAVGAMLLYSGATDSAAVSSAQLAEFMEKMGLSSEEAAGKVEASAARIALARQKMTPADELSAKEQFKSAEDQIADLEDQILRTIATFETLAQEKGISEELISQLIDAREEFQEGKIDAESLRQEIAKLALMDVNFSGLVAALSPLSSKLAELIGQAQNLGTILLNLGSADPNTARYAEDAPYREQDQKNRDFLAEQSRLNGLTKQQLALDTEIAKVRKDSVAAGAKLTDEQIRNLAAANIAADEARRGGGKKGDGNKAAERFDDAILKEIEGMKAETTALNSLTGAQVGYGKSVERARKEAELLQELQNKGLKVTPELRARVSELASEWEKAASANEEANARLERLEAIGQSVADSLSQAFEKAFTDPQGALKDLGKELAMIAIKMQLARLLPGVFGASGIVPLNFASGGMVRGPGTGASDSIPARLSNGEFVVNAAATARNRALLEAINGGKALALANGGYVGTPSIPTVSRAGGGGLTFQLVDQRPAGSPDMSVQQQRQRGPNGREMVVAVIKEEWSRGAFDKPMRGRQGVGPQKLVR